MPFFAHYSSPAGHRDQLYRAAVRRENKFAGNFFGMVAASIELISNLFEPVENLGMELQNIQQAVSGVRRVNEFYREPEDEEKDEELTAAQIIPDRSAISIRFDRLASNMKTTSIF